jgi:hypothetical protein
LQSLSRVFFVPAHLGHLAEADLFAFLRIGFVERSAQSFGQLDGIIIGPEVHEEQPWVFVQHVAVKGRYVDERSA